MRFSKLVLFLSVLGFSGSVFAKDYSCRGEYRRFSSEKVFEQKLIPLVVEDDTTAYVKLEAEVNDFALLANISKTDNEALLSIVKAPKYTEGVVSRTSLQGGQASASIITEENSTGVYTLYKVECYAR